MAAIISTTMAAAASIALAVPRYAPTPASIPPGLPTMVERRAPWRSASRRTGRRAATLQALPLDYIRLTPKNITQGLDVLRDMKSLETIGVTDNQNLPAAEFWERYGKGEFQE